MELEEMKATWGILSKRVESQEKLSRLLIEKIATQNYRSKLRKRAFSEYVGTIICYTGTAYLIMHIGNISSFTMQIFCVISILILFTLPIISLKSLKGIKEMHNSTLSYSETIRGFAQNKIKFQRRQKCNALLAMVLMLIIIPVMAVIIGKELNAIPYFWILIMPIGIAFITGFSVWVLRHYNKILKMAEKDLSEISN